jgi:hypothetical protein
MNKPLILEEGKNTMDDVRYVRNTLPIWQESDIYIAQLKEVFEITHPELIFLPEKFQEEWEKFLVQKLERPVDYFSGNWIYFPWSGRFVHTVTAKEYGALRTNRNRNIITAEEQHRLDNFTVGIIGLSVGSGVATTLAYSGIAQTIKLAEFDTLETTNLNRIRARIDQIGRPKISIATEQIYEVNPYATIESYSKGITVDTLYSFVHDSPSPQLLFEIIDSFEMKIYLRQLARERGIPVIMVTNLGDRVLLDVERYDLDKNTPFFNGRAGRVPEDILANPDYTTEMKHKYAVDLAGVKNIPERALASVAEIGKTLVGRPQLSSTVTTASGLCAYLTKKIALGDRISGSWLINFDELFVPSRIA